MNQLNILKQYSTIVADTGDIQSIIKYSPKDATTNPSIILQSIKLDIYKHLITEAINYANKKGGLRRTKIKNASTKILVNIGKEILKNIPGKVSTEVDAKLSFHSEKCIEAAENLIYLYELEGIDRKRVLIKLAATWEGIQAAKILEKKNIKCNLTLLFSFAQAKACADANVFLISPFVGRIYDWYNKQLLINKKSINNDPGVTFVTKVFKYFKKHNYKTIVMAASFRKKEQIIALSGCDYLTISPIFLEQLINANDNFNCNLTTPINFSKPPKPIIKSEFYDLHNKDRMAVDKLSEGIHTFKNDQKKLEEILNKNL
ncbi:transaldolase [Buchnera aphidicola (Nipponaphis monzeni)]|uniref:Transaldolase n=1 Tax=Buchnera aphidicola (Nipponaphis monzeni) TaxID=2495405 RepID=A0A455T9T8_9GAMM|nr:transaldolase [Buchnera aphidicola]BBI01091.1 transaldolase [Buchnera aphidicola (Nipponaphis monzeni)]